MFRMKYLIHTFSLTVAIAFSLPVSASASDWSPLGGIVLSAPVVYDPQAGTEAAGVDINMIIAVLNGGISYRHWGGGEDVRGWDGSRLKRDETAIYFGVGLLNMLQLQAGYSNSGASLRVRSDLVLFADSFPMLPSIYRNCPKAVDYRECNEVSIIRRGLVLSPYAEFTPFEDNHKTLYGLGVGVVF